MIPSRAYRQAPNTPTTRVDLVLALLDGAIDRMQKALTFLSQGDVNTARNHCLRAQLLVMQLAAGIDLEVGSEVSVRLLQTYEFCAHTLAHGGRNDLESACGCLATIRDGFRGIREEAVALERSGVIPQADSRLVEAVC